MDSPSKKHSPILGFFLLLFLIVVSAYLGLCRLSWDGVYMDGSIDAMKVLGLPGRREVEVM